MKKSMKEVFVFFHLGCYLSVWHCYLGSVLAFNIENSDILQPLNKIFMYICICIYIYIYIYIYM